MQIQRHRIELATTAPIQLIDITDQVRRFVTSSGIKEGLVTVSCLHTTARINVNEREEKLERDMLTFLKRFVPRDGDYLHNLDPVDGRDNAHSHLIGLFMNSSETIPVAKGTMVLGEWQSVFFIELDGPRERRGVELQIIGHVRDRVHAAIGRADFFGHIVLHDQASTDHLDVDHHRTTVIRSRHPAGDVVGRAAALIFGLRQIEQPIGDVEPVDRYIDIRVERRLRENGVRENLHSVFLSWLR